MGALHLVSSIAGLKQCLARLGPDDALLLLESAVYAATVSARKPLPPDPDYYVLQEHLVQRGIDLAQVLPPFVITGFSGFVALTTRHRTSVTWA